MSSTQQLPAWARDITVFDTETTGTNTRTDRIVTATLAVLGESGEVRERYDWLINPGVEIPAEASAVHGITTEMARDNGMQPAVAIAQIAERITEKLQAGLPLLAYNAPFDLSILSHEAVRYGVRIGAAPQPVLDPLVIDKQLDKYRRGGRRLEQVCAHYGVTLTDAHDAGADAIAAGQVMQAIARKFAAELPSTAQELHALQVEWKAAQAADFEQWLRRERDPQAVVDGRWPLAL